MDVTTAANVVARIAQTWPNATIGDQTVEAWADATPEVDPMHAADAIRRLAQSDEFAPSVARFLATVRLIVRERSQPSIAAGPIPHSTRQQAASRIAALRSFWHDATIGRPDHNHMRGDHTCPRCSTSDAFLAEQSVEIAKVLREFPVGG